ncbi:MAG: LytTR family DNA-binding domain-containing protein [Alphaproteobacteria bacterium]
MTTRKFIIFNIVFWVLAGLVLFLESLPRASTHIHVAIVRNLYFPVIGFLISFAMISFFRSTFFQQIKHRLGLLFLASGVAALITAVLLNPITYLMLGRDIQITPHEILSTGTLYFVFIYFIWSVIYSQLAGQSILHGGISEPAENSLIFKVEKAGEKRLLKDHDICLVRASGDYVELVTKDNTYLIKETLSNLEERLDAERFKRVHRSAIVNRNKIETVVGKPGGSYELTLDGGHIIQSSRSYKINVELILPEG